MMEVYIDLSGQREIIDALKSMEKDAEKAIEQGLLKTAFLGVSLAQRSILKGPKTGRIYKLGRRVHQASAPGEPPANDTGRLVSSLRAEISTEALTASLIAGTQYAIYLEFGTRRMEPRPFLRPAAEKATAPGIQMIIDELNKALRK